MSDRLVVPRPRAAPASPASPAATDVVRQGALGRYRLFGELGAGGMAVVYLGGLEGDPRTGEPPRLVAIKRMREQYASDAEVAAMFLDEIRLCSRVAHDNVVATLDVAQGDDDLWLVLELVEGETLSLLSKQAFLSDRRVPTRVACAIAADILLGLHAAHEAVDEHGGPLELVHRDVSPSNVLVGIDGVTRVLDFGIAKACGRLSQTRQGEVKGKIAYMSPEQARGLGVDRRCDVFSASVILWELLVGRRMFSGEHDAAVLLEVLERDPTPPGAIDPKLARFDALITRGLARDRQARFPTALAMVEALKRTTPLASRAEVATWLRSEAKGPIGARRAMILKARQRLAELATTVGGHPTEDDALPDEDPFAATLAERSPFEDAEPGATLTQPCEMVIASKPIEPLDHAPSTTSTEPWDGVTTSDSDEQDPSAATIATSPEGPEARELAAALALVRSTRPQRDPADDTTTTTWPRNEPPSGQPLAPSRMPSDAMGNAIGSPIEPASPHTPPDDAERKPWRSTLPSTMLATSMTRRASVALPHRRPTLPSNRAQRLAVAAIASGFVGALTTVAALALTSSTPSAPAPSASPASSAPVGVPTMRDEPLAGAGREAAAPNDPAPAPSTTSSAESASPRGDGTQQPLASSPAFPPPSRPAPVPRPTTAKPSAPRPSTSKPTTTPTTTAKPSSAKPPASNPSTSKPTTAKPPASKPASGKPAPSKPARW